jgi:hypothetical protein
MLKNQRFKWSAIKMLQKNIIRPGYEVIVVIFAYL